jgi:hypothetical protein
VEEDRLKKDWRPGLKWAYKRKKARLFTGKTTEDSSTKMPKVSFLLLDQIFLVALVWQYIDMRKECDTTSHIGQGSRNSGGCWDVFRRSGSMGKAIMGVQHNGAGPCDFDFNFDFNSSASFWPAALGLSMDASGLVFGEDGTKLS